MRFCYIVQSQYRNEIMPMSVAYQLMQWGHDVDFLEPQTEHHMPIRYDWNEL